MSFDSFESKELLIYYEDDGFNRLQKLIASKSYSHYFVLTDSNTERDCWPLMGIFFPPKRTDIYTVEPGDASKSLSVCVDIWMEMNKLHIDRQALMINLGGGMICDLGAFTASLFKRGIDFINLPTSLLGMVDASIGGKCGINFNFYKNQIGLFRFPLATFIFVDFLKTLPRKEVQSGSVEAVKHALIANKFYFEHLRKEINKGRWLSIEAIKTGTAIKKRLVSEDVRDLGVRKKLNFGHTIGHAIETFFHEQAQIIPHGLAVAAGIICESYLSVKNHRLPQESFHEIVDFFKSNYSLPQISASAKDKIISFLDQDKKRKSGQHQFVLLAEIGQAEIDQSISESEVADSLDFYCSIQ